jgi:hypothetical protein
MTPPMALAGSPRPDTPTPTLAAQRLCTDLDVGWLGRVGPSAVRDTLARLEANPTRFAWVAEALFKQRQSVSEAITAHGARVWRTLTKQEDVSHQTRVLLAVGGTRRA